MRGATVRQRYGNPASSAKADTAALAPGKRDRVSQRYNRGSSASAPVQRRAANTNTTSDPYGGGTEVRRDGNGKVIDNRGPDRYEQGQMPDMYDPERREDGWREDIFLEMCAQLAYSDDLSSNSHAQNILRIHGYRTQWYVTGNDPQTGMFVGVLGPEEPGAPYIVCFRGTEPTTLADLAADTHPGGVGVGQFYPFGDRRVNPEIVNALGSIPGGGNIVTGHSLGGALAQLCAAHYSGRFGRVVTFQAPGIPQEMVDRFNQQEQRPRATHHIAAVDAVDRAGQEHLPGVTYMHHTTQNDFTVPAPQIPLFAQTILQHVPGLREAGIAIQLERAWNFIYGIMYGHMRRMLVSYQLSDRSRQVGMNGNWGYPHQIYGEGALPTNISQPITRYERYPEAREDTSYEIDRTLAGILGRVLGRIGTEIRDAAQAAHQAFQWFVEETIQAIKDGVHGGLEFWRGVFGG